MRTQPLYAILGLAIGAFVSVLLNLIAAGIQQRAFATQFSNQSLWVMALLAFLGLLIGYWLGEKLKVSASSSSQPAPSSSQLTTVANDADTSTITRLKALLSYGKLKGKGIHLKDIVLIGSRIDIET